MRALALLAFTPALAYAEPVASTTQWLTLGATSEAQRYDATRGIRGEADFANLGGWTLGVGTATANGTVGIYDGSMTADVHTTDVKAIAYVARAARFEHFELRGQIGLGAIYTSASGDEMNLGTTTPVHASGVFPTGEAALRATVPISARWAATGGALFDYYDQWFGFDKLTSGPGSEGATHRLADMQLLLGLSYRL